ncbi:MAG TPA: glycosyltransferase family 2 protein [Candidatus Nitrosotenuis sp.]|jgi:cellulose synthase/poly-beta-1,6-N-acetylglucosamine synthase-like glycosyltransferase|nr:glycosyltransferase family 2 protein [Candidatus Nitrosotenuis sp.]
MTETNSLSSIPKFGELLVNQGLITADQLEEALHLQQSWRMPIGEIVVARGFIKNLDLAKSLARHLNLPFVNLRDSPPKRNLLKEADIEDYLTNLYLPISWGKDHIKVACASPSPSILSYVQNKYGVPIQLAVTSKFDIIWIINEFFEQQHTLHATEKLKRYSPKQSASVTFTTSQLITFLTFLTIYCVVLFLYPIVTLYWSLLGVSGIYVFLLSFRLYLMWLGVQINDKKIKPTDQKSQPLPHDYELPLYTILVPLFHEREVLLTLAKSLRQLDYPKSKLDIKLIFEENDPDTIAYAKQLGLEEIFEFIVVPYSEPQSKPKALNYALRFARGEFVTIYDAEDKPEKDQLKKVVARFRALAQTVVCLQAKLNFFNVHENLLSRLFTLDYSIWFDFLLPALDYLKIPIPLGGTSNHFKMSVLREIHSWDPHNVTEDADLGVRISALGYAVGTIQSTTYEEANIHIRSWIRQRSRWIKGYMQTWLVHMRDPIAFYQSVGSKAFWGFQLFIGGNTFVTLINPLLWLAFIVWITTRLEIFDLIFSGFTLIVSFLCLIVGNGLGIYMGLVSAHGRRLKNVGIFSLMMPFYWILQAIAGFKAATELVRKPFYWHKTPHGLTKFGHLESHEDQSSS